MPKPKRRKSNLTGRGGVGVENKRCYQDVVVPQKESSVQESNVQEEIAPFSRGYRLYNEHGDIIYDNQDCVSLHDEEISGKHCLTTPYDKDVCSGGIQERKDESIHEGKCKESVVSIKEEVIKAF